jgi:gamma-glutamylcyclotransferase (GGCT)/AIG2-like uncharacterized protein YtfP
MNPHLFVYGSLMSTAGHRMGAQLGAEARLLGPATIQGRLYRVAWYPGVVEDSDPRHRAHGELYALDDPAHSLAWLDAYEGISPGNHESDEYMRVERPVELASGQSMTAWVYLYCKAVEATQIVADGRWRPDRT